jgi:hypothetical protein
MTAVKNRRGLRGPHHRILDDSRRNAGFVPGRVFKRRQQRCHSADVRRRAHLVPGSAVGAVRTKVQSDAAIPGRVGDADAGVHDIDEWAGHVGGGIG